VRADGGPAWISGRHLPGTLLLCAGMLCARAGVALALSSALVHVLHPVAGSLVMALLFLNSAALGRPITMRLARDFVALPAHLFHHRRVRRKVRSGGDRVGVGRLLDAGMSLGFLHWGADAGLLSRGVFSGLLTAITIVVCTGWGTGTSRSGRSRTSCGMRRRRGHCPACLG
jgi:hypothetical protein